MNSISLMKKGMAHVLSVIMILSALCTGLTAFGVVTPEDVFAKDISEMVVGDTVYMGKVADGYTGGMAGNITWKVIGSDSSGNPLLMSEYLWKGDGTDSSSAIRFNSTRTDQWAGSEAEEWCNNFYTNNLSNFSNVVLDEKAFFLSTEELDNLNDKKAYFFDNLDTAEGWWLRTPGKIGTLPAISYVKNTGEITNTLSTSTFFARPSVFIDASADICARELPKYWIVNSSHDWSNGPTWNWTGSDSEGYTAASATFTCKNDSTHTETVTATVTNSKDGNVTTYTAKATLDGTEYTDTKTVTAPEKPEIETIDIDEFYYGTQPEGEGTTYAWAVTFKDNVGITDVTSDNFTIQSKVGDGEWTNSEVSPLFVNFEGDCWVAVKLPDNTETSAKQWRFVYDGESAECPAITQDAVAPSVDKSELEAAITAANAVTQVATSADGSDINPTEKWTTEADKKAFTDAIAAAQAVISDDAATQQQVDDAKTALDVAVTAYEAAKNDGTKVSKPGIVIIERDTNSYPEGANIEFQPASGGKYVWLAVDGSYVDTIGDKVSADDFKLQIKTGDSDWTDASEGSVAVESIEDDALVRITATIPDNEDAVDKYWRVAYKHSDVGTQYASCESVQIVQVAKTDKTALESAISAAEAAQKDVKISEDGTDVDSGDKYVTAAEKKALDDAIAAAQKVLNDSIVSQTNIDKAVTALNTAVATYEAAKKDGEKSAETEKPAMFVEIDSGNEQPAAGGTYKWAFFGDDDSADWSAVTSDDFTAQVKVGDGEWTDSDAEVTLNESDIYDGTVSIAVPDNDATVVKQWRFKYAGDILDWSYSSVDCPAITQAAKAQEETVDKTALEAAITSAKTVTQVATSEDGSDIDSTEKWTTEADKKAFTDAIAAAEAVMSDDTATQQQVDDAKEALDAAVTVYEAAKKNGTKDPEPVVDTTKFIIKVVDGQGNPIEGVSPKLEAYLIEDDSAIGEDYTDFGSTDENGEFEVDLTDYDWIDLQPGTESELYDAIYYKLGIDSDDYTYEPVKLTFEVPSYGTVKISSVNDEAFDGNPVVLTVTQNGLPIDKTALEASITAANAVTQVATSADGSDIDSTEKWTTEADKKAFTDAIAAAQAVMSDDAATQQQVDAAKAAIDAAVTAYEAAKKDGTKEATDDVSDAKKKAKDELDKIDTSKYEEPEKSAVEKAIDAAKKAIDEAATVDEVNAAKKTAEDKIAEQKTKEQKDKEAAEEKAAKEAAEKKAAEEKAAKEAAAKKAARAKQKGKDGTALGAGASAEAAEKAIISSTSEEGPKGSKFGSLALKSTKQGKNNIQLAWKKVKNAKSYVVYGNECGKKSKMKKLAVAKSNKFNVRKISKKLRKGKYHKFMVVALDRNNNVISSSKVIHVATKGGKIGNHKSVKVSKKVVANAKKLKKGKSLKLKAKAVVQSKKLKVKKHRAVTYESSNTKIATVSKKGVVKAKKKGTCYIYAYAQNGAFKRIKVTVK